MRVTGHQPRYGVVAFVILGVRFEDAPSGWDRCLGAVHRGLGIG